MRSFTSSGRTSKILVTTSFLFLDHKNSLNQEVVLCEIYSVVKEHDL